MASLREAPITNSHFFLTACLAASQPQSIQTRDRRRGGYSPALAGIFPTTVVPEPLSRSRVVWVWGRSDSRGGGAGWGRPRALLTLVS